MCVEATSTTYENYEMQDFHVHTATWNKQIAQWLSEKFMVDEIYTRLAHLGQMCMTINSMSSTKRSYIKGSYIVSNSPNGHLCPREHISYHTYLQPPFNEIYLCNFKGDRREEPCPFELGAFQRMINQSK